MYTIIVIKVLLLYKNIIGKNIKYNSSQMLRFNNWELQDSNVKIANKGREI